MEITIMNNRVFRVAGLIIFVLYAMHGEEIYAHPAAKNSLPVECGKEVYKEDYKDSGLDNLASNLSKIIQVNRIQESIGIRIPEQRIFGDRTSAVSHDGKQLLARLAGDLECYPDTLIYIEENSGSLPASIYHTETQLFRVQTLFRENGIDINRLEVDVATSPPDVHPGAITGNQQATRTSVIALKIIPRV